MSAARLSLLTGLALLAFAGNSLFCRAALASAAIDPASFTGIRLVAGAVTLWAVVALRHGPRGASGDWRGALALFAYAVAFSFSYVHLGAASGALILFGAVQLTMIGAGLLRGERFGTTQLAGLLLASGGLVALLRPGLSAPPLASAALMLMAGIAWGVYSLLGRRQGDPLRVTAGNFLRAAVLALVLCAGAWSRAAWTAEGLVYALLSGALTSGLGYVIWYAALPSLRATTAATVQLSVPVIAALGSVAFLGEILTLRLVLAGIAILGGVALVVRAARP